jgi:adenosine deaminase
MDLESDPSAPKVIDVQSLPKAVLHEHLDGGLRVATVIELADAAGIDLPSFDESELTTWFHQGQSGSLESYLEAFDYTTAVMQTQESVSRIAYEAVEDLANDGVVYAEIRFGPALCTKGKMGMHDVLEAALDGYNRGSRDTGLVVGAIVSALRQDTDSESVAIAATRLLGHGVVGFDLAGPEEGFPPDAHLPAIRRAHEAGLGVSLHAGEGDGPHSIWRAIALCSAQRIGHGVHIADVTDFDGASIEVMDTFATRVRDARIPLEVAISSNLHTGSYPAAVSHPFGALYRAGFNVSINTDNRLMSGVTVSSEYALAASTFALSASDLGEITVNAVEAGFGSWTDRKGLIDTVIKPAYGLV